MTVGILAEKPSQARNFAKALGGMSGTFEGTSYVICCARGHVVEFAKPAENVAKAKAPIYRDWSVEHLPWDVGDFKWDYVRRGDVASVISGIKRALSPCDEVVIGTDDDPTGEGELLAWEALDAAGISHKRWSRMYFADEAPASVKKAFRERKPIVSKETDGDYLKALYRSKWDYLSMQFTRAATAAGDGRSVLRQGRLKSAMVVLVGDQLARVKAYKKVPYYTARFKDENGVVYTDPAQEPKKRREDVDMSPFHVSAVVKDGAQRKTTAPPRLMDLAALSARLAPKGIGAKQVLSTYQKMYDRSVLSYPRTEDKFISSEQFDELLPLAPKIAKVVGVDPSLLTHTAKRKTHVREGGAHGANRPGTNVPASLAALDAEYGRGAALIYETLAKNYLAMLCEDYVYERQTGHVADFPTFKGSANVPKEAGWKAVFDDEEEDDDENAKGLGKEAGPFVYEGFPPKPQNPTMRWLMRQLENRNVGTGATRTSIYAEVVNQRAKYPLMVDTRGRISFTEYGEMSYGVLPGTHIGDLAVTERLMEEMEGVAKGTFSPKDGFAEIARWVAEDVATMAANGKAMRKDRGIVAQERVEGVWQGEKVSFNRVWAKHRFTDDEVERLLAGETIEIEGCVSKQGNEFSCKGRLGHSTWKGKGVFGFQMIRDEKGADSADRVSGTWKPNGKGRGQKVSFKRVWGGHTFTDDEVEKLLAGETIEIRGLQSKSGNTYGVRGKLAKQTYNGHSYVGFKKLDFI